MSRKPHISSSNSNSFQLRSGAADSAAQPRVSNLSSTKLSGLTAVDIKISDSLLGTGSRKLKALWDDGATCNYIHIQTFTFLKTRFKLTVQKDNIQHFTAGGKPLEVIGVTTIPHASTFYSDLVFV